MSLDLLALPPPFPPLLLFVLCSKRGFEVRSFGTGSHVKLPGPAPDKPNVYDFKTTYEQMYNDLVRKDKELYPHLASTHAHTHTHCQTNHGISISCNPLCFTDIRNVDAAASMGKRHARKHVFSSVKMHLNMLKYASCLEVNGSLV